MKHILEVNGVGDMGRDANGKKWEDYDTIKLPNGKIIDMNNLLNEQAKAKAALIHLSPIFSAFVNKLKVVYTFHVKTQATDGYHLFVNPAFTNDLSFQEKVFVMAHECMHCLLDHMRRGKYHDHKRSNIAADYEVNDTLVDMGLFKATTIQNIKALYDKKYTNWSYERIYDDNPKSSSSNPSDNTNGNGGKGGNTGDGNQQHSADYVKGWNKAMADYKAGKLKI